MKEVDRQEARTIVTNLELAIKNKDFNMVDRATQRLVNLIFKSDEEGTCT